MDNIAGQSFSMALRHRDVQLALATLEMVVLFPQDWSINVVAFGQGVVIPQPLDGNICRLEVSDYALEGQTCTMKGDLLLVGWGEVATRCPALN